MRRISTHKCRFKSINITACLVFVSDTIRVAMFWQSCSINIPVWQNTHYYGIKWNTVKLLHMTSRASQCPNTKSVTEYFNFMENNVAAVIRLMTQARQTVQICGTSAVRIAKPSVPTISLTSEKAEKENVHIEHLNYTQIFPFWYWTIWCYLDCVQFNNYSLAWKESFLWKPMMFLIIFTVTLKNHTSPDSQDPFRKFLCWTLMRCN